MANPIPIDSSEILVPSNGWVSRSGTKTFCADRCLVKSICTSHILCPRCRPEHIHGSAKHSRIYSRVLGRWSGPTPSSRWPKGRAEMLVLEKKRIDPDSIWWKVVFAATGQPVRFE